MTYLLEVAEQFNQLKSKQFELAADLILEIKGRVLFSVLVLVDLLQQ